MDLMMDVETLGSNPGCVITQIGAVYFDRSTGALGDQFLVNVQIQDCLNLGLIAEGDAIKFWLEQAGRSFLKNPQPLGKALQSFRDFASRKSLAWAHATFDFPVLGAAYRALGQRISIPYRNMRDIRTLVDLAELPRVGSDQEKTHHALEDCVRQVRYCVECFRALKKKVNV